MRCKTKTLVQLRDLRDSNHMKNNLDPLSYIVAVFKDANFLRIVGADFNIQHGLSLPRKVKKVDPDQNQKIGLDWSDEDALAIGRAVLKTFDGIEKHLEQRKWTPKRSALKDLFKEAEASLTLPAFTKRVSKYVPVSEDTVKRDINKGIIQAAKTSGGKSGRGHYRIPETQVPTYVAYLKLRQKHRPNGSLTSAIRQRIENIN